MKSRLFALTLSMLTGDAAPEGPGWYLLARSEDDQLGPYRLDAARAEAIGKAFEETLPVGDETIKIHPFHVVKTGTAAAIEAVTEELEEAEAAATRVARLRRLQTDLGGGSNTKPTS